MKYLIFAIVLNMLFFVGTIILVAKAKKNKFTTAISVIKESKMNLMFCLILYSLALALIIFKFNNPILSGVDTDSYIFISLLSIFSTTVASYVMVYTLNRKFVLTDKNVVSVDLLGQETSVSYNYISAVKLSRFKKTIYLYFGNDRLSIHCSDEKILKNFVLDVNNHLKNGVVIEDVGMFSAFKVKKEEHNEI